jgi:hypothetical protein
MPIKPEPPDARADRPWLMAIAGTLVIVALFAAWVGSVGTSSAKGNLRKPSVPPVATVPATLEPRVSICHRTGPHHNPDYKEVEVNMSALNSHLRHGDIYPVPPEGCPGRGTPVPPTPVPTGVSDILAAPKK